MPRVSQQYKDERRREIVAAASECFLEHGYEGASMHRIIAATGLSAGALYNHFPSKQELVAAAARAALDRVLAAAEDEPGTDPAAWVVGLLERLAADPATTRLLLITWGGAVRIIAPRMLRDTAMALIYERSSVWESEIDV